MTKDEREELIAILVWRMGWKEEAFKDMSDDDLIKYRERLDAGR